MGEEDEDEEEDLQEEVVALSGWRAPAACFGAHSPPQKANPKKKQKQAAAAPPKPKPKPVGAAAAAAAKGGGDWRSLPRKEARRTSDVSGVNWDAVTEKWLVRVNENGKQVR